MANFPTPNPVQGPPPPVPGWSGPPPKSKRPAWQSPWIIVPTAILVVSAVGNAVGRGTAEQSAPYPSRPAAVQSTMTPEPTASESEEEEYVEEPSFRKNELAYLKAVDELDGDYAEETLAAGYALCKKMAKKKPASAALYLLDEVEDFDAETKYLCKKLRPVYALVRDGVYEGEHKVGRKGVKPGTYRTRTDIKDCYWARVTKGGSIIANDFVSYAPSGVRVTIRKSDGGFQSNNCGDWVPVR